MAAKQAKPRLRRSESHYQVNNLRSAEVLANTQKNVSSVKEERNDVYQHGFGTTRSNRDWLVLRSSCRNCGWPAPCRRLNGRTVNVGLRGFWVMHKLFWHRNVWFPLNCLVNAIYKWLCGSQSPKHQLHQWDMETHGKILLFISWISLGQLGRTMESSIGWPQP